jgi:hypothetical protein
MVKKNQSQRFHHPLIQIAGVDVIAHRLFGPQPFTATYVCIWELHLGAIKAILSSYEAKVLFAAGNAFRLSFVDTVNAPATEYAIPPDPDRKFISYHHVRAN